MQKATEYNVKDSNVENIGSDMDKAARHAAAMTECEWEGAGQVRRNKIPVITKCIQHDSSFATTQTKTVYTIFSSFNLYPIDNWSVFFLMISLFVAFKTHQ